MGRPADIICLPICTLLAKHGLHNSFTEQNREAARPAGGSVTAPPAVHGTEQDINDTPKLLKVNSLWNDGLKT